MQQNSSSSLGSRIAELRKKAGLTQEQLADQLGLTYQAVSKWENGLSCPDILLLPRLATLLGVSTDGLLGQDPPGPKGEAVTKADLPWPDDQTLRAVLYEGHQLLKHADNRAGRLEFVLRGPALNVVSECDVTCGDVENGVVAGGNVQCGDISGDARAAGNIECGDIGAGATAGGGVECGDIGGSVSAGGGVECGDVGGNASAGGGVDCGDVGGSVSARGSVSCGDVCGSVQNGNAS